MRKPWTLAGASGAIVLLVCTSAPGTYLTTDEQVEVLLKRADAFMAAGKPQEAVAAYLKVEERLESVRKEDPTARPLVRSRDGVYRAASQEVRRRVVAHGEAALAAYLRARGPRMQALLRRAQGAPRSIDLWRRVVREYPLSPQASSAAARLGDLLLERGRVREALGAYRTALAPAAGSGGLAQTERAAVERALSQTERLLGAASRGPQTPDWPTLGGGADRARTPQAVPLPGSVVYDLPVPSSELTDALRAAWAGRGLPPPSPSVPAADPARVYLSDAKVVAAFSRRQGALEWVHVATDPQDTARHATMLPDRLDLSLHAPFVAGGRVYATLYRNTPPTYDPDAEIAPKGEQDRATEARDWRLVCLDAASGRLLWDAASQPALEDTVRNALHVSSPLVVGGRVFLGVIGRPSGDLQAHVLALDAESGALLYRVFVSSVTASNYRNLAAWFAPPAAAGGRVYLQPNLGAVAALDPETGDLVWAATYPSVPQRSQKRVIERGLRFGASTVRVLANVVVAAPLDAEVLLGLDRATGQERWRFLRGAFTQVVGSRGAEVVLAGSRRAGHTTLLSLDARTGQVTGYQEVPGRLAGRGVVGRSRVLLPLLDGLAAFDRDARGHTTVRKLRYPPTGGGAGNLVVAGDRLLTAGPGRLTAFEPLERSIARLREAAAQAGPAATDAKLAYAWLLARGGAHDDALAQLFGMVAADPRGADRREVDEAIFTVSRWAADEAVRSGHPEAAPDIALRAAPYVPARPDAARFLAGAADALAAAGHHDEAVRIIERMTERLRGVPVGEPGTGSVPVETWARTRLRSVRKQAPEALGTYDRHADRALDRARQAQTPAAYQAVADAYPTSPAEASALLALADLFEKKKLLGPASRALARLGRHFPDQPDAVDLLLRRARLFLRMQRFTEERGLLAELKARFGADRLPGQAETLGAFADGRIAQIDAREVRPALPPVRDAAHLKRTFQTWADLTEDEPRVVIPEGLDARRAKRFLVVGERSLAARDLQTGLLLWRWRAPAQDAALNAEGLVVSGGAAILAYRGELSARSLETGAPRWTYTARDLRRQRPGASPRPPSERPTRRRRRWPIGRVMDEHARRLEAALANDPDPIKGVRVHGRDVVAVLGATVVCIDARTGVLRWRARPGGSFVGPPLLSVRPGQAPLCAVVQESPALIVGLRLTDGKRVYALRPGQRDPRLTLRPVSARPAVGKAFCVLGGSRLLAIDVGAGQAEVLDSLPFWPRQVACDPSGEAVCVLPHGASGKPGAVVYDGRSGEVLLEIPAKDGRRVNQVALSGDDVYVLAGDYRLTTVRAFDWRTGQPRWEWRPEPGRSFHDIVLAERHLVLARSGPARPGMVYLVDRAHGRLYRRIETARCRAINAEPIGDTLVISTNRGLQGYGRVDRERLQEERAALLAETSESPKPPSAAAASALADRLFKAGETERAVRVLSRALASETIRRSRYERLYRQLLGYADVAADTPRTVTLHKLGRAPEIDGQLDDAWPLEQSYSLSSARHVTPIQGYGEVAILRGHDDLSGRLYLGYDARYLYFALDVTDSSLVPYDSEAEEWKGDCLLIALDAKGDGGDYFMRDDNLLSLALALPKKKKDPGDEDEKNEPDGKFFVKRKDDGSGAIYEAAIPWRAFKDRGAAVDPKKGPAPGFTFGFNVVVTDADDEQGARKALEWVPSITLHRKRSKLWDGFIPGRFIRLRCK